MRTCRSDGIHHLDWIEYHIGLRQHRRVGKDVSQPPPASDRDSVVVNPALNPTDYHDVISKEYVRLTAARLGFDAYEPGKDRTGVDLVVAGGADMYPQLEFQLKGTSNLRLRSNGRIGFSLTRPLYEKYRSPNRIGQLIFVLVHFPALPNECIEVRQEEIALMASAYFTVPREWPESSPEARTVEVPIQASDRFDDIKLAQLMEAVATRGQL